MNIIYAILLTFACLILVVGIFRVVFEPRPTLRQNLASMLFLDIIYDTIADIIDHYDLD